MNNTEQNAPKFRRRAEARPDEVMDAALDLFVEQGFAQTKVEQIARKAGLSKGAVYLYFPSKMAILEGLVARAIGPITGQVFSVLSTYKGDPRPIIGQFMRMMAKAMTDPKTRAVPLLVLHEAPGAPEVAAMFRRAVLDHSVPALRALIAQGVEGGHIRAVDPDFTVRTILGPFLGHLLMSDLFGIEPDGDIALDQLVENHLTILFAGLAPGGAE